LGIVLLSARLERRKTRVKIAVVVSELPPVRSGVALSAKLLTEHYRGAGHEVSTMEMRSLPNLIWGEIRLSFFFFRWPSIRRELSKVDCVHLHGPAPTFSDLFLLLLRFTVPRERRPKVIYTQHFELDLPGMRLACRLYNRIHSWILRFADAVVVTTHDYQRLLIERGHPETVVIPLGADHFSYRSGGREEGRFDILTVAQLRPYKGVEVLLEAFGQVPEGHLHIVGDGHRRRSYEAQAVRLGLARVCFHGELSDSELSRVFASSHVIVLPSISMMEAFGLSLLEGMRIGCVPVASNLPGVAEVVGDAGILVPPGDAKGLAEALCGLQRDRALLARLSHRARRRADSFRWAETGEKYLALIERVAGRDRNGRQAIANPSRNDAIPSLDSEAAVTERIPDRSARARHGVE
jgi:glycosyltransferase involved in cell wall biosynthesis